MPSGRQGGLAARRTCPVLRSLCACANPLLLTTPLWVRVQKHTHTRTHTQAPPSTELLMFEEIAKYLEHVIKTANPQKLVLVALDGVAPRAKICQQRA